ncbi:hypothetical protein FQA47_009597 [Oryzias melastigma]|uniref:Uncharacterized protein n=1 Tax=Oryzias melastigma TaxID=30732 RepID=A0A834CJQ5_ORYME|nr:hypothetical protein FQA47_009597 [Oryzias melastigma]
MSASRTICPCERDTNDDRDRNDYHSCKWLLRGPNATVGYNSKERVRLSPRFSENTPAVAAAPLRALQMTDDVLDGRERASGQRLTAEQTDSELLELRRTERTHRANMTSA